MFFIVPTVRRNFFMFLENARKFASSRNSILVLKKKELENEGSFMLDEVIPVEIYEKKRL